MKDNNYILNELNILIGKYKEINLKDFSNYPKIYKSISFITNLLNNYKETIEKYIKTNVIFSNYREFNQEPVERIRYFIENYQKDDLQEQLELFIIFNIIEESKIMFEYFDVFEKEEIEDHTPFDYIDYFEDLQNEKDIDNLLFLKNGDYKILFTGFCDDDIPMLQPYVKKSMLRIIESDLSKKEVTSSQDMIGNIKDKYGVDFKRIHVAKDYRLTYYRHKNVTAILGIGYKTGHNQDYTKFRPIASNIEKIDNEIDKFISNNLSNPKHDSIVQDLYKFIEKKDKKY